VVIIEAFGKRSAWEKALASLGQGADIVPTHGHLSAFPRDMSRLGLSLDRSTGVPIIRETLRSSGGDGVAVLRQLARKQSGQSPIYIATDDDSEGDVIAWDAARILLEENPSLARHIRRARPAAMTAAGIDAALKGAIPLVDDPDQMALSAINGRVRAAFDRWIGHTLSEPGLPAGRVRLGVLAGLQAGRRVETTEVIFKARCAQGGAPFTARLALFEPPSDRLRAMLDQIGRGFVPGTVQAMNSLSAAAPPRLGPTSALNTAQALMIAGRRHGLSVARANAGLQQAYLEGLISYPRVDSTAVSQPSLEPTVALAADLGLAGFDPERAGGSLAPTQHRHEALHPLFNEKGILLWRSLLAEPRRILEDIPDALKMAIVVARGALEAGFARTLQPGTWDGPTNAGVDMLADLDWVREQHPLPPWPRHLEPGVRYHTPDTIMVDVLVQEGLGQPSTLGFHATRLAADPSIDFPEPGALPRPSAIGQATLRGRAAELARRPVSHMLEMILSQPADPAANASIPEWISLRLRQLLARLGPSVTQTLVPTLEQFAAPSPGPAPSASPPVHDAGLQDAKAALPRPDAAPRPESSPTRQDQRRHDRAGARSRRMPVAQPVPDPRTTDVEPQEAKDPARQDEIFPSAMELDF
jgi:DNA topoisomerase-1